MRAQHAHILDALSGKRLDALEQCVAIDVAGDTKLSGVNDVRSLCAWFHERYIELLHGKGDGKQGALLTAPPAAGKTTMISQAVTITLDRSVLVPIVVKVQKLQVRLLEKPQVFSSAWNWIDAFVSLEHTPEVYRMVRQVLLARRALLLIDGLDEGGKIRDEIVRHVEEVLAPQGHVMLLTSRPAGLNPSSFASFHRLQLSPLSDDQQLQVLRQRLGEEGAARLQPDLERMPIDTESKQRVTSNPLMLSMTASVFELRQGIGMPSTVAELYDVASAAMLKRSGDSSVELVHALSALFCTAHIKQQRIITEEHLQEAQALVGADVLRTLEARALQDRMPLLSLLQVEPLQLQSSHLSFQEYFAARQLCEEQGTLLAGTPPWQWSAWWANVVKLGNEMGDPFYRGLARAAGVGVGVLDLENKLIAGDRTTALPAVCCILRALTELNISSNKMDPKDAMVLAQGLKGNNTLTWRHRVGSLAPVVPEISRCVYI